jgi:hypothetical protein
MNLTAREHAPRPRGRKSRMPYCLELVEGLMTPRYADNTLVGRSVSWPDPEKKKASPMIPSMYV